MRSDRLLSLMLILQGRKRVRGAELAKRLSVSERTIYRDVDALSAAGVPVYAQPGPQGGIALLEGWRTDLTGLTEPEVRTLAAIAVPAALADIGLSESMRSTLVKLAASLPAVQQRAIEHARARLHFDGTGWFDGREEVPHLQLLRDAVWQDRKVRLRYTDFDGKKGAALVVSPYGLVIKVERWYLVAGTPRGTTVFRGSRVSGPRLLAETFVRPSGFDLAAFWRDWCRRFDARRASYRVTLRLTRDGEAGLARVRPAVEREVWRTAPRERDGRKTVTLDFERESIAIAQLLTLAPGVEVVCPPALREALRDAGARLRALYP
jgi:predicted DNA-binding transcriptional regulator YafY